MSVGFECSKPCNREYFLLVFVVSLMMPIYWPKHVVDFYDKEIVMYRLNMLYFYIWRQHWDTLISQTQHCIYRSWPVFRRVMERKCDTFSTTRKRRESYFCKGGEGEQITTLCTADRTAGCHVTHARSLSHTKFR